MVSQATYASLLVPAVKYQEMQDHELLSLVASGLRDGLEVLYERYATPVFSLALHMLRDRGAAEEVTQDVFLSAWRNSSSYQLNRGTVSAWLLAIAHHRAVDELRRRQRRVVSSQDEGVDLERQLLSSFPDPLESTVLKEEQGRIRKALRVLSPEQRDVVVLAYFKGYTHSEIAKHLDQPLGTVKTRIRLAMKRLREALDLD